MGQSAPYGAYGLIARATTSQETLAIWVEGNAPSLRHTTLAFLESDT